MDTFKIGICDPADFSPQAAEILRGIGKVEFFQGGDLNAFLRDKSAAFVRLNYRIDDLLLRNCDKMCYICSPTTGLNHIQISRQDIKVLSLKGEYDFLSSIRATPEHVFGLTLALLRNYAHAFVKSETQNRDRNAYKGFELYHNTVGIIGLGRIGKLLARYFAAFDAEVFYYDNRNLLESETNGAKRCDSIKQLIERVNIVILEANYTEENRNMISASEIRMMRGKYFINAARGELVDETELLNYARRDWFRGLAIDVFANETENSEFLSQLILLAGSKNIIITPHIGGATYTSMERTEIFVAKKLEKEIEELAGINNCADARDLFRRD